MYYNANKVMKARIEAMDLKELILEDRACRFSVRKCLETLVDFDWGDEAVKISPKLKSHRMKMLPVYAERIAFIQPLIQMAELMES